MRLDVRHVSQTFLSTAMVVQDYPNMGCSRRILFCHRIDSRRPIPPFDSTNLLKTNSFNHKNYCLDIARYVVAKTSPIGHTRHLWDPQKLIVRSFPINTNMTLNVDDK